MDGIDVVETAGRGIRGRVDHLGVAVGMAGFVASDNDLPTARPGRATVLVWVADQLAGEIIINDPVRPESRDLAKRLRRAGVRHVAMVSGDKREVAEEVAGEVGLDAVYADQSPEDKLAVVRVIRADERLRPVVMVGDGINDAPALALADVGIALGAAGATVSSETADAVIAVDRVDRVADAIEIGHRSMRIARESVLVGIGLSALAMLAAAAGYLPPIAGALTQEVIDVAVILNALRALRG